MAEKVFEAKIYTTVGGGPVTVRVSANGSFQAQDIIKTRPEFKSFAMLPREVK